MSTGKKIPIEEAQGIAIEIIAKLRPYCERIEVAGSIRRNCETVGDIEIVCIPKTDIEPGLFGGVNTRSREFIGAVYSLGYPSKGLINDGSYVAIELKNYEIKLDLFITTPEKWGWIYLLRTGSAEYSARIARALKQKGYELKNGHIRKVGVSIPVYMEADVYELAGLKWIAPNARI